MRFKAEIGANLTHLMDNMSRPRTNTCLRHFEPSALEECSCPTTSVCFERYPYSITNRMTSPAISKSPEKQKSESKSPSHASVNTQEQVPQAQQEPQADPLSCLRIFKLAGLMMKQGC
ncbi:unnamed protein product [Leptosia nina]|uniref:Uncharacterized protein n=1 Tax=Leptosia nina TaxID=320188 RepID=A0AAV1K3D6_9NEOP